MSLRADSKVGGAWIDLDKPTGRFPNLFREVYWPGGQTLVRFELFAEAEPPDELISNVNLVAKCALGWLMLCLVDGSWEIPDGTLEPGESYRETIRRELREEAGAEIQSCGLFGGWRCRSHAENPYRPHLPFPEYYRVVALGEVLLRGMSGNPSSGEYVVAVECVTLEKAVRRFWDQGRDELAELYALADFLVRS